MMRTDPHPMADLPSQSEPTRGEAALRKWMSIALFIFFIVGVTVIVTSQGRRLLQPCVEMPCAHFAGRMATINSQIAQTKGPRYLMVGDSLTERARLPKICGRAPINAGIGWATTRTWLPEVKKLVDRAKPDFIIIELGANDIYISHSNWYGDRMRQMADLLKGHRLIFVPLLESPKFDRAREMNGEMTGLPLVAPMSGIRTPDGLHVADEDYPLWLANIKASAEARFCPPTA